MLSINSGNMGNISKVLTHICLADLSFLYICFTQGRSALTKEKGEFAHDHKEMKNLEDIVREIKPTAIIGKPLLIPTPHQYFTTDF